MSGFLMRAAVLAATMFSIASTASAEQTTFCTGVVTEDTLIACALRASLVVQAEHDEFEAAQGRKTAVSTVLPANPVLSVSGSRRSTTSSRAINWYASLAQEVEIGGQRGARRRAADAELDAHAKRLVLFRREVAASAWVAFYEALAAHEEQQLTRALTLVTQRVSIVARARAEQGLIAPVDADLAEASATRALQTKLSADRRLYEANAKLASLLGLDPARAPLSVLGDLTPIAVDASTATRRSGSAAERPEILVLEAERKAFELRATAYRRARISNPTISVFAENDGFNERVLGLGISLPIPLPGNVGRTYIGEILEAEALARRAGTNRQRVERELRLTQVTALHKFESLGAEVDAFKPEQIARAHESLRSLAEEVAAGHLSVRDAVVVQQALIELLQAHVAARAAWCLASVDLARALGMPLERQAR